MAEDAKKKEAAPKEAVKKEAPAPAAPKEVHVGHAHGKKVGRMTLAEVESAIEKCQKTMGGLWSDYGKSLVGHRDALKSHQAPVAYRKAA